MTSATAEREVETAAPKTPKTDTARVAGAAGIMMAAILASRLLGLVRDMVISYYFGASWITDAYKAAFRLPDFLYYLIAGGALSSAFIPVFTEYLTRRQECDERGDAAGARACEDEAWRVFSIFGTLIFCGLTVVVILGELVTVQLLQWFVVPGWQGSPLQLTANLTRIIFPAQLCFFLGGLMMATLYARKHFLMPALGPVVYNVAIIVGGVIGGAFFGPYRGIYGLAIGVVVGAIAGNIVMQLWAMRRFGVHYRPSFDYRHPGVVKIAKLMLPVLLGLSLPQLHLIIANWFASFLTVKGTITWLDNANKLMQMPLGIFGQALSVALLPTLSSLAAERDFPNLRKQFNLGLRAILFLTIPSSVLIRPPRTRG
jgi:putative peptidoglycan lipid II flippase